jgi:hypothetical protein
MSIPEFTGDGLLPAGVHDLYLDELLASSLVIKPVRISGPWDSDRRLEIGQALANYMPHLWHVGITNVFVDGSFATSKASPSDADCYFECEPKNLASIKRQLEKLDPIWTWDDKKMTLAPGGTKLHRPMWHKHKLEIFWSWPGMRAGLDSHRNPVGFPEFFSHTEDGRRKGIIRLRPRPR